MKHLLTLKMIKRTPLFLLLFSVISCSKSEEIIEPPVPELFAQGQQLQQYGTAFKGVPDAQDATIYQVNMRTFSSTGNFKGVVARLDSIKALGVNVIYLMPMYPVGAIKTVNSPYCIKDYKAISPEFGNLVDLRAIVDGAHSRNMAVLLDWVANHTSWDNPWIADHKNWYAQDAGGNIISPPNTGWNDVAQLDFSNKEMRLSMISAMKYWVYAANVDGFRCDFADGPPTDFWKQALDTLRNISTHKLLMLAEGSRSSNFGAGFDLSFGFHFFGNLKDIYGSNKSVASIDGLNGSEYHDVPNGKQVVRYTTNHDVNSSDGTPLDLFGGIKGSMTAFVIAAYMKSVPMIYNGQEVGLPYKLVFPFTSQKVDWSLNPDLTAEYKKIIAFRNTSNAIRRGSLTAYNNADVCAFTKEVAGEKVLVLVNARNSTINFSLPAAVQNTTWQNVMTGESVTLATSFSLSPYSYYILKM